MKDCCTCMYILILTDWDTYIHTYIHTYIIFWRRTKCNGYFCRKMESSTQIEILVCPVWSRNNTRGWACDWKLCISNQFQRSVFKPCYKKKQSEYRILIFKTSRADNVLSLICHEDTVVWHLARNDPTTQAVDSLKRAMVGAHIN